jgi:hypothetical protein
MRGLWVWRRGEIQKLRWLFLQEHGDWGSGSAKLAAQIITAYVNKKRKQEGNLLLQANKKPSAPVEVGAVWSTPGWWTPSAGKRTHGRSRGNGPAGGG